MKAPILLTVLIIVLFILSVEANAVAADTLTFSGKSLVLDDALFTGCHHNAFEGHVEMLPDGSHRKGKKGQGILRTKGVLQGAGTVFNQATLAFHLAAAPAGETKLVLNGVDDSVGTPNVLAVAVNGTEIQKGPFFAKNDISITRNDRYQVGWKDVPIPIPAGLLKAGDNTLTITNTSSCFDRDTLNYSLLDFIRLELAEETTLTLEAPPPPIYYYGLTTGPEVNVWPAVNLENRICLLQGVDLEYNFYITLPRETPLGTNNRPADGKTEITLHILAPAGVEIADLTGNPLEQKPDNGGICYSGRLGRLVGYETPHPAQGLRLLLRAKAPLEKQTLTAWCSVEGKEYLKRTYALRAVQIEPLSKRIDSFLLSIWGGGVPQEPQRMETYVDLVKRAGFNHMFTGAGEALNQTLREKGFSVYPRYGWFGGQYKVAEDRRPWAAITATGETSARDFCPLAILEHADDAEVGKYFTRTREHAALPHIDGLCVDFECGAVWCWCDRCLKLFAEETGIAVKDRAEAAPGGPHEQEYKSFGRRRNRDLLTKVREVMKSVNPKLNYTALASACDMPSYWWDGRLAGRHSLRELVKFADTVLVSAYFYNLPGGLKSVRPLIQTTRSLAMDSGRSVDVGLIAPLASTVSETPRFQGLTMNPQRFRLLLLLAVTGGARALSLFRGDCFDGEHFLAARQTMEELVSLEPFIRNGLDRSFEVDASVAGAVERRFRYPITQNFLSRVPWHPDVSYDYEVVQLVKDHLAKERVLLVFNLGEVELPLALKFRGLFDSNYAVAEFKTGKALAALARTDMESGKLTVNVPPLDCLMLRVMAKE